MTLKRALTGLVCASLALTAVPAAADVKAGVDAWGRGDYAAAVKEWRGPAAKGDADAQFNLAQAYRLGRGVPADMKQAEELYAKAAAHGHLKAADNYGLLLFQDGRRRDAMPYVIAAAERGDPRAQYLLGIAHFNGDLAPKDWVRAYALLTLSNAAGLPQAAPAIKQMDDFIPLEQRQQAQTLAAQLKEKADAQRASQFAAADLATAGGEAMAPAVPKVAPRVVGNAPNADAASAAPTGALPSVVSAEAAVAEAMRATGTESPATAGADYARAAPAAPRPRIAAATPSKTQVPPRASTREQTPPPPAASASSGPWKLQLGAFSVPGNADKLWARIGGKGVLAGKTRLVQPAGRLTRLLAGGWASEGAAQAACGALKASGTDCLVTR
ncbi:MAG: SPOR domain-containing protein [Tsuneonella sp.]